MSFTPAFGRIAEWDKENERYLVSEAPGIPLVEESVLWECAKTLNQGTTPRCTSFSFTTELICEPESVRLLRATRYAGKLHAVCGDQTGASILSCVKELTRRGLYRGYYWGKTVDDVLRGLRLGPCVIGIEWRESMNYTTKDGYLKMPKGKVLGLHCLLIRGSLNGVVFAQNTWGKGFGIGGYCMITLPVLAKLLSHPSAEICFPMGRRQP